MSAVVLYERTQMKMMKAIDVHAHCGDPKYFSQKGLAKEFLKFDPARMAEEYAAQQITAAFFSPMEGIFTRDAAELLRANAETAAMAERYERFYFWVVVHPELPESFAQAGQLLSHPKCVGVKIHPDAGRYDIAEHGEAIFSFCRARQAVLLTHTGEPGCMPEDFVPFADRYPDVPVILAHLGHSREGRLDHQVLALRSAESKNLYIDLSSASSLLCGLLEWAVGQIGTDRLLFGSDVPLHHLAMMKARVEGSLLGDTQKEDLLYNNAARLFADKLR